MHKLTLALTGLAAFHSAFILARSYYNKKEKDALLRQVMELNMELHRLKENCASQEQRMKELTTDMNSKISENKTLWEEVESLTCALFDTKAHTNLLVERYDWERSIGFNSYSNSNLLTQDLNNGELRLANTRREKLVLTGNHYNIQAVLERLTSMYSELEENSEKLHGQFNTIWSQKEKLNFALKEGSLGRENCEPRKS